MNLLLNLILGITVFSFVFTEREKEEIILSGIFFKPTEFSPKDGEIIAGLESGMSNIRCVKNIN
ncbi:hypothetical protein ACT3CD_01315 [Geofilum sp. OHC36d9]|uniref:hypothetical protein n=1 Tax=Geofilum sp. OHC36d9 TaxID=3458413 RepID=UPI004033A93C